MFGNEELHYTIKFSYFPQLGIELEALRQSFGKSEWKKQV